MIALVALGQEPGTPIDDTTLIKEQPRSVNLLPSKKKLPHSVKFEIGRAEFAQGDSISISSIHGTSANIDINETYQIDGSYVLTSHKEALVGAFVTTNGSGRTSTDPQQEKKIKKGKGTFSLLLTIHDMGFPHISFYPTKDGGEAFGGLYFGQGVSIFKGH